MMVPRSIGNVNDEVSVKPESTLTVRQEIFCKGSEITSMNPAVIEDGDREKAKKLKPLCRPRRMPLLAKNIKSPHQQEVNFILHERIFHSAATCTYYVKNQRKRKRKRSWMN